MDTSQKQEAGMMLDITARRVNRAIALGATAVVVLFAVAGGWTFWRGGRGWPKKDPELVQRMTALDSKIKAEDRALAGEPLLQIDAIELRRAYDKDAKAADDRFRNRRLLVSGIVKTVVQEGIFDEVVVLKGPAMFEIVRATLIESEAAKAANLTRGGPVVLLCTGNGRILQTPSLTACSIQ
jgi:hypothetical protein